VKRRQLLVLHVVVEQAVSKVPPTGEYLEAKRRGAKMRIWTRMGSAREGMAGTHRLVFLSRPVWTMLSRALPPLSP
jgi:hypothetical protein